MAVLIVFVSLIGLTPAKTGGAPAPLSTEATAFKMLSSAVPLRALAFRLPLPLLLLSLFLLLVLLFASSSMIDDSLALLLLEVFFEILDW